MEIVSKNITNVIGHINPDTDSICSAIAYAALKNEIGEDTYIAKRAGQINSETQFVLRKFGVQAPAYMNDVRTQVIDIDVGRVEGVGEGISLKKAWEIMRTDDLQTLPIVDGQGFLKGLITIQDIAKSYMDVYDSRVLANAQTSYINIIETLEGVEVRLSTDYFDVKDEINADKVIYTGMIDEYYNYKLGVLEYRSVRFETERIDMENYQGNAVVNYTSADVPYTRIIEHKHFNFGTQPTTVISREYSSEWSKGDEPYYPVNNERNNTLYGKYEEIAESEDGILFGGRLGQYKYYDMDKVIAAALNLCQKEGFCEPILK